MTNYEKYVDKIKEYKGNNFCEDFMIPHNIIKSNDKCDTKSCVACMGKLVAWLSKDYEESDIDWNKVAVDTPVLVRSNEYEKWFKRHFAKYEDGKVYTWINGRTSWNETGIYAWKYAKLVEPEVDWNKVEVDTPILVRYSEKGMWIRRKFAKFEDGVVYAWHGKEAGHSKSYMTPWNYAKLAESERKDNISESNANNRR